MNFYLEMTLNITYGDISLYPKSVIDYVTKYANILQPDSIHICDGSQKEKDMLIQKMIKCGTLISLPKYQNCYLARTNPDDVARVEKLTCICTPDKNSSVPEPLDPSKGTFGNWCNDTEMRKLLESLLYGAMKGRILYVIPFCMGTPGSDFAKLGIQLTDSPYVVVSMGIMTTMGISLLNYFKNSEIVFCVHSVLCPRETGQSTLEIKEPWPCNPKNIHICHFPNENEIISCGSGYGGNSLLGKKCFALRIANTIAHREGWLAEHMLILRLEKDNIVKYVTAAFPSACGKTNLAMITPTIPGWTVKCVGDDIAWLRFNKDGKLMASNPERGFFGVAPGTSYKTNPMAMETIFKDTIFTNVASTNDGGVYWEGMDIDLNKPGLMITDWLGNENWKPGCGRPAAHPNSRFCAPIRNCPILDPKWDCVEGVPIDIMIFGGRRPYGVPLVIESLSWKHGVLLGASVKSETTSAASDMKANVVTHDPMAMRPFMGYNFGKYISHWLSMDEKPGRKMPRIFHVNWFRKDSKGEFMWPGFGENIRALKYMFDRCNGENNAIETAIGYIPDSSKFDIEGLKDVDLESLFKVDKEFWLKEMEENDEYFKQYMNKDYPEQLKEQIELIKSRLLKQ